MSRKMLDPTTAQKIHQLGPWFHNMEVGGIRTAPDHFLGDYPNFKWEGFRHLIPADLTGKSVLDVGCNAGFYSLEMKRRGANLVVGIDHDARYLAQARFAAEIEGLNIVFEQLSVYEVGALGQKFDLVMFMGVFYHLRHPLMALDLLYEEVVGDMLLFQSMLRGSNAIPNISTDYVFDEHAVFETEGYPRMVFVENSYAHDPTNWWIPNRSGMEAMLRSAGFATIEQTEDEVYLCRRGMRSPMVEPPPAVVFTRQ